MAVKRWLCAVTLANGNQRIRIEEKTLEFFSAVSIAFILVLISQTSLRGQPA